MTFRHCSFNRFMLLNYNTDLALISCNKYFLNNFYILFIYIKQDSFQKILHVRFINMIYVSHKIHVYSSLKLRCPLIIFNDGNRRVPPTVFIKVCLKKKFICLN